MGSNLPVNDSSGLRNMGSNLPVNDSSGLQAVNQVF